MWIIIYYLSSTSSKLLLLDLVSDIDTVLRLISKSVSSELSDSSKVSNNFNLLDFFFLYFFE